MVNICTYIHTVKELTYEGTVWLDCLKNGANCRVVVVVVVVVVLFHERGNPFSQGWYNWGTN